MRMPSLDCLIEAARKLADRPPASDHFDSYDTDVASLRSDLLSFAEKASNEEIACLAAILANRC